MIAFLLQLFAALASVKALVGYAEEFARGVVAWYVQNATSTTLAEIADAAAMQARAESDEDRYKAAEAWQKALSRPRVTS